MKRLLDVNALLAFGIIDHEFHERVVSWINELRSETEVELATCSITELGFVRVVAQTPRYGFSTPEARALLMGLKAVHAEIFKFIPDDQDISQIPGWVRHPKQVTDGHLLQLAKAHGAILATLDSRIPGAFLIPPKR
ncbi:MAG: PIN domain-containing protein [Candidatus Korobacteraceae bacterium]